MLITALCLLPKVMKQEIFKHYSNKAFMAILITTIITPYFIIGSIMCIIDRIIKKFKKTYNNNILVLSNLMHKFISYKSVLYLVLLLSCGAMTFIGTAYSMYSLTEKVINEKYPYDISFIENDKCNKISEEEVKSAVKESGNEIKEYKVLESLNLIDYRVYENKVIYYGKKALISESNYNKHMGTNISVNRGEIVQVATKEEDNKFKDSDIIINFDDLSKQKKQKDLLSKDNDVTVKKFLSTINKENYLYINKSKKIYIKAAYTNKTAMLEYKRGTAFIINDEDYKKIKDKLGQDIVSYDHLIILNNHKDYKSFEAVSNKLKELNKGKKEKSIQLRTLQFKQENLERAVKENGFMLFSSLFLGRECAIFSVNSFL